MVGVGGGVGGGRGAPPPPFQVVAHGPLVMLTGNPVGGNALKYVKRVSDGEFAVYLLKPARRRVAFSYFIMV